MTNADLFQFFRNATILFATLMLAKYFLFLNLAAWFPAREQRRHLKLLKRQTRTLRRIPVYRPLVSVIVPAWNEEVGILRTMLSVLANDYPYIELVVVNDGSTDGSRAKVDRFIEANAGYLGLSGSLMRQYYVPQGGKGRALNYGVQHSQGKIVLTLDADSALAPDAISKLVHYFRDPSVSAVVGQVRIARSRGRLIGVMQRLEYLFGFYFKRAHCVLGAEYIYGGACAAFRRSDIFDAIGLFDEANKTEDIEMSMRTKFFGLRSVYAEDVMCYTEGASNYMGLLAQRLRWKKGRFDTFMKYRRMFFSLESHHNKPLAWMVLPLSLISELQLLLEPIGATLLITYCIVAGDYVSLALSMLFVGISYLAVALCARNLRLRERLAILVLWPLTWPLFYVLVWVEFHALIRSVHMGLRGEPITWQNWGREGI
jgi:poly-beta-1,6-N-acetyl-D-glucosamine synthase